MKCLEKALTSDLKANAQIFVQPAPFYWKWQIALCELLKHGVDYIPTDKQHANHCKHHVVAFTLRLISNCYNCYKRLIRLLFMCWVAKWLVYKRVPQIGLNVGIVASNPTYCSFNESAMVSENPIKGVSEEAHKIFKYMWLQSWRSFKFLSRDSPPYSPAVPSALACRNLQM